MSAENNENVTLVQCPFCAEKINAFAKKCRYCGEFIDPALRMVKEMQQNNNPLPRINTVQPDNTAFANTVQQPAAPTNISVNVPIQKQRIAYILLGVFLGGLGIHNFYAGYTNKGLIQLLVTVCAGWLIFPYLAMFIWSIVDICTVEKDANGIPFC